MNRPIRLTYRAWGGDVGVVLRWQWRAQDPAYANYGNANQWTVNAGMTALARESTQVSKDARVPNQADLVFTLIRLTGVHRAAIASRCLGYARSAAEARGSRSTRRRAVRDRATEGSASTTPSP